MKKTLKYRLNLQHFASNEPEPQEPEPKEPDTNPGGEPEPNEPQEEMISKSEMEKIIKERVAREKKATEKAVAEAEKLAKMNAEEKREHERQKLEEELAEYKRKDQYYSLSREATNMLHEHGITADDELLGMIVKDTAEDTQSAVNSFVTLLNTKVEDGVKQALSGNSPRVNTGTNAMTKKQILSIKDRAERQRAIKENIQLFN